MMADARRPLDSHTVTGTHASDSDEVGHALIQLLPNELMGMILGDPDTVWASALVCTHWRDIVGARPTRDTAQSKEKHMRPFYASSALSALGHLPPAQVQTALESVLPMVTLAHLMPLLVASDKPEHVDYALRLWSHEDRSIDVAEAVQWHTAHGLLESRFYAAWPRHVRKLRHVDCNHPMDDVRAIASCVILSVAARHTCSPDVLQKVALSCLSDQKALHKAAIIAAAYDRRDTLGALLYLYAQRIDEAEFASIQRGKLDVADVGRSQHTVTKLFRTLYVMTGTYGSVECARTIDLFPMSDGDDDTTPLAIMPQKWHERLHCRSCGADPRRISEPCALTAIQDAMGGYTRMRKRYWLKAAIAADRPETLDLYLADAVDGDRARILGDTARLGKRRFARATVASCADTGADALCVAINNLESTTPFTLEGVRWLSEQPWYSPQASTFLRILENVGGRSCGIYTTEAERLRNTVDMLDVATERWPTIVQAVMHGRRDWIGILLVLCIVRGSACGERDLLGTLVGHLDRCALIDTPRAGSVVERVWSYLIETVTAHAAAPVRHRMEYPARAYTMPMAGVFVSLLIRYEKTLHGDRGILGPIGLVPLSRDLARRALFGPLLPNDDNGSLSTALAFLYERGLLM